MIFAKSAPLYRNKVLPLVVVLLVVLPGTLFAQQFRGTVTDATGAVVPNATVTVHNQGTNINIKTKTTGAGVYTVPYLKPGLYTVSAEASGFKKAVKTDITLETGLAAVIDLTLQVGAATDSIVVKADSTLLDFAKADRGEVMENSRITEMPVNGRSVWMLSVLQAGVRYTAGAAGVRPFDDNVWRFLNINGGGDSQNQVLMDGVSNEASPETSQSNSRPAYMPSTDSIQEFKIVTAPYDAQYGRLRGGALEMTLKSGTNKLHGDIFEFARRGWLDANSWVNDYNLLTKPASDSYKFRKNDHKLDQYGFELDGPIVIPHVYNGRDKAFFVLQYENWNENQPSSPFVTQVPDPAWLTGDFSNLTYLSGGVRKQLPIYDPLTTDASGKRTQFPGNIIPANRLNPTALKILSYYPQPNTPVAATAATSFTGNYIVPNIGKTRYRNALAKIDYKLSDKDRFGLRYGYNVRVEDSPLNGLSGVVQQGYYPLATTNHTFVPQWTHTVNSNLLFDFRALVSVRGKPDYRTKEGFDLTQFWPAAMVNQLTVDAGHFPQIQPSGFVQLGSVGNTRTVANSLSLMPTVTWIKGKHTVRAGSDLRWYQYAVTQVQGGITLAFNGGWTTDKRTNASQNTGNAIADMLLGTGNSGTATINNLRFIAQHYFAPFVQDDWKISSKLTVNLGLRWDFNMPDTERNNNGLYAFNTTALNPIDSQVNHLLMPNNSPVIGGPTFRGVGGNPDTLYATSWRNIQPRFGFAYAFNDKTVLRGGIGEFFQNPLPGANYAGFTASTPYVNSPDGGLTPAMNLANPFPTILQPTGSSLGMLQSLGQGPWFSNPNYKIPNVWQMSFGIQRQLGQEQHG